jgi:cobalt-zinc-cadmium efflux system protein
VAHSHAHGHDHHVHHHAARGGQDRRWLGVALAIVLAFMVLEVVAGILASSLALLSDAAHMVTDAAAIGLAVLAASLAERPARGRFTFGLGRAEILSAQANGAALLVLAGVFGVEAVGRLVHPHAVDGAFVLVVGLAGAGANLATAWAISRAQRRSLNVEGAQAHVLADLAASLTAAAAGAVILVTGFDRADPIATLLVSAYMLRSAWGLLRESTHVLLEGAPRGVDPDAIGRALAAEPGVVEVHDLHVWEVTSGFPALAAHVLVPSGEDCHAVRRRLQRALAKRFGIEHVTLQVDHAPDADRLLEIQPHA